MGDRFSGKVVWVTGASSGIGEALARRFSDEGASVVLSARRADALAGIASGLRSETLVLPLDICKPVVEAAETALAWKGRIDILVHNAGVTQRSKIADTSMDTARRLMEVNFWGAVELTHCVLPAMIARGQGHIVAVGSVAGYVSTPERAFYSAAKHALRSYCDTLRAETVSAGIDVTYISPGYIKTGISERGLVGDGSATGRIGDGDEKGMSVDSAAERMMDAIAKRRREVSVGGPEVHAILLQRWFPGLVARWLPRAAPK